MSGVYSLSTTVEITFILPKVYLKKWTKKQLNFKFYLLLNARMLESLALSNNILALCEKLSNLSSFIFHLSFPKVLYKSVLLSVIKVPYKRVLSSIITCRHLSLTYHTQKYFIKAFYYLAKTWLCVN